MKKLAIVLLVLLGPTSHFTLHNTHTDRHTDKSVPVTDILGGIFILNTSARGAWLRQKSCQEISFTNNHISADTCNTTASEELS
jgi:hypothetical protein